MKTVLHVNTLYYPDFMGGAERSVQALAESLAASDDVTPVVVALTQESEPRTSIHNGVKIHHVPLKNLYWSFNNGRRIAWLTPAWHAIDIFNRAMAAALDRVLTAEAPDIVHTHNLTGWSVAVWDRVKARGLPLVHTLRDYSLLCPKTSMFSKGQSCLQQCRSCAAYSALKQRQSRQVDAAIGISQFILDMHLNYRYFPNARQRIAIGNPTIRPERVRAASQIDTPLRFGYIGKLSPHKGIEVLLEATRSLPERGWQLAIGGKGEADYVHQLQQACAGLPIEFLGYVNPDEFYRSIDIAIVPSLWNEPFGRVIVEAYAYGVPAIVSQVGGAGELAIDGKSGYAYDASATQLAAKLNHLLHHPDIIPEMSAYSLELAKQYSSEAIRDRYLEVYETVLSR